MKHIKGRAILAMSAVATLLVAIPATAADYPAKWKIPVTYFDFHADSSCPDFQVGAANVICQSGWVYPGFGYTPARTGLVQNRLDAEGLPQRGANTFYSWGVPFWFREWSSNPQCKVTTIPVYRTSVNGTNCGTLSSMKTVSYDTSYKNIMIEDSLELTLENAATGTYIFKKGDPANNSNPQFLPLDPVKTAGKSFGCEGFCTDKPVSVYGAWCPARGNFAFTLMIKSRFTYRAGTSNFLFYGDDDVWMFIDSVLVVDLGGISNKTATLNWGSVASKLAAEGKSLVDGETYSVDFFCAERCFCGSSIELHTNIFSEQAVARRLR